MSSVTPSTVSSEPRIRAAIARAADDAGVDFAYLYNQARIESGLNPHAKARTSSATGLFQFTAQTWLHTVATHGADHGAAWAADAIGQSGRRLVVTDPDAHAAIFALRTDPEFSSAMAAEFAADNRMHLETALGRPAAPVDLYLAHFLGRGGAVQFLTAYEADPQASAAPLFPAAAAANRAIFYRADGVVRSLADVRNRFAEKLGGALPPDPIPASQFAVATQHIVTLASDRAPAAMAAFAPMPQQLSVEFAAQAYARLAALGS
jgi:hypothetical protein